jgi:hypothetical protein
LTNLLIRRHEQRRLGAHGRRYITPLDFAGGREALAEWPLLERDPEAYAKARLVFHRLVADARAGRVQDPASRRSSNVHSVPTSSRRNRRAARAFSSTRLCGLRGSVPAHSVQDSTPRVTDPSGRTPAGKFSRMNPMTTRG